MSQFQPPSAPLPPGQQQPWSQYPSQPLPQQGFTNYPPIPQYPPMPQYFQPPPVQPPKKKGVLYVFSITGGIVLVTAVLFLCAIALKGGSIAQNITASNVTSPSGSANTQATSAPNSVGSSVSVASWLITVNGVTTHTSGEFSNPSIGDVFLVVDVTSENTASTNQNISSFLSFRLTDSTGQAYNEAIIGIGKPPDGTVPAKSKLRGQISYEVPSSEQSFTFEFLDILTQDSATWNISVK